ncbi:MAG TPA: long-chain-fatty-acid--CoA ligase [Burkholderiales bacterium]|jgi:acyl-CoA synthetase (AMP-forming)/AMP-acid ligase II|nr:long-chain-fatty-acid--CoA ligase [Burkholderiales bacterium]
MVLVPETIQRHGREKGGETAYWTPGGVWTFAQLEERARRVARGFASLGIGPGDRVACLTKHTAECVALVLGANKIGAVCMPVNWRLAPPEIEYIVNNGRAKFMLCDRLFVSALEKVTAESVKTTVITEEFSQWFEKHEPIEKEHKAKPEETALQLYSSGTTGLPKGVELTHGNLAAGMMQAVPAAIGYHGAPDVMLNALPTYHIAGVGVALLTACKGGASVLYPDFDPAQVIKSIAEHRITHSFLVPAMIQFMLQVPGADKADYSSLKGISYGASPISEKVLVDAMRTFKCRFMQVYGLTETTGAITALSPEDHDPAGPKQSLLRSAGKPIDGVELRVVDPASGADCKEGQVGEVWIRTAQNMKGYWANPNATTQAFVERWFRSGDAGFLKDGYLFLHDRIKDMIVSGGENIYPAEVENALMQHPAVADGAVIGVPDEQWGEAVKACVVLKKDAKATQKDIIDFMRGRIAHFKCPKSVDFVEAIPRNPTGKILKRILREPYWKGKERRVN